MKHPQLRNFKLYYEKTKEDLPKLWVRDTTHRLYRDWNREATRDIIKDLVKWGWTLSQGTLSRVTIARHKFSAPTPEGWSLRGALKRRAFHDKIKVRGKTRTPRFAGLFLWLRNFKWRWYHVAIAFLIGLLISGGRVHAIPDTGSKFTPLPKIAKLSVKKPKMVKPVYVATPAPKPVIKAPSVPQSKPSIGNCGDNMYKQFIYSHESGCNTGAVNYLGCRGIGQACPGGKLPCGNDFACQDAFFTRYALAAYGSWANAYYFWLSHHWW